MNLCIRSQDKEKLISCNDIVINNHRYDTMNERGNRIMHFKGYEIIGYVDKNTEYEILGIYETKERALEILDEIQELLESVHITDISKKEGIVGANIFYEMPKE